MMMYDTRILKNKHDDKHKNSSENHPNPTYKWRVKRHTIDTEIVQKIVLFSKIFFAKYIAKIYSFL